MVFKIAKITFKNNKKDSYNKLSLIQYLIFSPFIMTLVNLTFEAPVIL